MAGVNKATLLGNIGRDPKSDCTSNGKARCSFSMATTKRWGGEDHTEWHNIILWEKLAEIGSQYLHKGSQVYIEGEIRTRKYEKDGRDVYITEIIGREMQMLGGKDSEQRAPSDTGKPTSGGGMPADDDDDLPF